LPYTLVISVSDDALPAHEKYD